jgi:hypothetical protein
MNDSRLPWTESRAPVTQANPVNGHRWWGGSQARAGHYLARRVLLQLIEFGGQHYERGDATPTRRVRQPD